MSVLCAVVVAVTASLRMAFVLPLMLFCGGCGADVADADAACVVVRGGGCDEVGVCGDCVAVDVDGYTAGGCAVDVCVVGCVVADADCVDAAAVCDDDADADADCVRADDNVVDAVVSDRIAACAVPDGVDVIGACAVSVDGIV